MDTARMPPIEREESRPLRPVAARTDRSSTNRDSDGWFARNECGYELEGDYNAAKNIGKRSIPVPEGNRPSGWGDGHLALKSGTSNLIDGPSSAEFRPEGESTAKPTTSVVG
jgi:hypothetical protein